MRQVKDYLEKLYGVKKYVVFNSHSHWDHIWGNHEFIDCPIIAHNLCAKDIKLNGESEHDKWKGEFKYEEFPIVMPNVTFDDHMTFEEDEIEFFYSPGHTEDSSSCYDSIGDMLFVADNIDDTNPSYLNRTELLEYKSVLERYLKIDAKWVVHSHGDVTDNRSIKRILEDVENRLRF
jgi:glyoxylase-like metal-dependent hydrolase (beta-lactamase superfamily II)